MRDADAGVFLLPIRSEITDSSPHRGEKKIAAVGVGVLWCAADRETAAWPAKRKDSGGIRMTREVIGSGFLGVWLGCLTAAAAQLPPEIQMDRYLLRAERLVEAEDPKGALEVMGKIVALQKEHGLALPEEFHFKHAKVALSAGSVQEAMDAVTRYLVEAGRGGKFYREALELLEEVEQFQTWFDAELTCTGKSEGAECWMEVTDQPSCYVWNGSLALDASVTWTGGCSGGRAQGQGTLKWDWEGGKKTLHTTGILTDGKRHGQWVERYNHGTIAEGPFVDGKEHGQWVIRREADGGVFEGPYVDGKMHGRWVLRFAKGKVEEGPYVGGKRHGDWVEHDENGTSTKGPYEEGEKHGHWVGLRSDGSVYEEGPYVKGEKHGHWVTYSSSDSGKVFVYSEGPYREGEKHGKWVSRHEDGTVHTEGPYVHGKRHGHWVRRTHDGGVLNEGPYVEGERHGHWLRYAFGLRIGGYGYNEGPYVKGKKHGRWLYRQRIGNNRVRVTAVIYENGESVRTEREWKERYKFR